MPMSRMKALLFGSVEKIVIHCAETEAKQAFENRIRREFAESVPVSVQPPMLGMEYVQVHYSAGLLRVAHADIMVFE